MDLPAPLSCFSFARPTSSLANSVICTCANLCRAKNRSGHGRTGRSGCYGPELAMSTGVHQPSARFCFFTAGCYTLKVKAIVSVTLTATDIKGADLSESLAHFWQGHREGAWNKLATATLSWLSFIPNTLSHLVLLSRSLGNRWKETPGFWLGLLSQLVTYVQAYCVVLDRTSRIPSFTSRSAAYHRGHLNRSSCSHARAFQSAHLPVLPFTTIPFKCCKRATGCDVIHPCILSLACNRSIHGTERNGTAV